MKPKQHHCYGHTPQIQKGAITSNSGVEMSFVTVCNTRGTGGGTVCNTGGTGGGTRAVTACDVWPVADGAAAPFTNVASGKPAVQSSLHKNNNYFAADKALDGMGSPCSRTSTNSAPPHWWQVDLQNTFRVTTVTVTNTIGKREERLWMD